MIPKALIPEAYAVGGTDAGDLMHVFYPDAEMIYPVLPKAIYIATDTPVSSWGLAWYLGMNELGEPVFKVRDDVVLNSKIAYHESGHAFQDICSRLGYAQGIQPADTWTLDRYW